MSQIELDLPQPGLKNKHGGRRPGAGRKKSKTRKDPLHRTRPSVSKHQPQHCVLRTRKQVGRLRRGKVYDALRGVLRRMLGMVGFRIVHVAIQHNHLHLIVEANGKQALRLGMQSFAISAARAINRVMRRKGKVFEFRYHATAIKSPCQARHALAYVLNNWRRHKEDETSVASRLAALDPYSTARSFSGWKEESDAMMPPGFSSFIPLDVSEARTWLLSIGWKKHGRISLYETPGTL